MKAFLKNLYWNTYLRYQAFRWIFRTNLGNEIIYHGERYTINNGTVENCWTIHTDKGTIHPKRKDCRYVLSMHNIRHSYRSGFWFYKNSWLDIWKREGVKPWMRCVLDR